MGITEILTKAVMNTLLGMGTVFSVLIFISFVISRLKYLPGFLERFRLKKPNAELKKVSSEEIISEEPLPADDQILVAVITAALTASKSSQISTGDGYFVRAIKRV